MLLRPLYFAAGFVSLSLGLIGIPLPLLPTVPFLILAAFCFARSSPKLEARLLAHPRFGPHISRWREHRAIGRTGKRAAIVSLIASLALSVAFAPWPWPLVTAAAILLSGSWIWTRPEG